MLREPKFGIELSTEQLSTRDSASILYGVTPQNKFIPIRVDALGRLEFNSNITLNANANLGLLDTSNLQIDPATEPTQLQIKALLESSLALTNKLNLFGQYTVSSATETTILHHVAATLTYITGLILWGTVDGEFLLKVNDQIRGGGRNSPTNRTVQVDYTSAPIEVAQDSTVDITFQHYSSRVQTANVNLLGKLT